MKLRLSKVVIVLAVVFAVLGSSMTTVAGLAENDIIPGGDDIIFPDDPLANYIPVTYLVNNEEAGFIDGEADQLILPGEDASSVIAVAEDGWMFVGWDDGYEGPDRTDRGITEEKVFIANFEIISEGDGEEGGDGENNGQQTNPEGDSAEDLPAEGDANVESESNGDAGDKGDGSGSSSDSDGGQGSTEDEGEGKGDGQGLGAGGKWEDSNQFIDGKTYYKEQLELYYQMAMMIFAETGEIPPEYLEFFEMYYNSI